MQTVMIWTASRHSNSRDSYSWPPINKVIIVDFFKFLQHYFAILSNHISFLDFTRRLVRSFWPKAIKAWKKCFWVYVLVKELFCFILTLLMLVINHCRFYFVFKCKQQQKKMFLAIFIFYRTYKNENEINNNKKCWTKTCFVSLTVRF